MKLLSSAGRSPAFEELVRVTNEAFSQEEHEPEALAPPVKHKKPTDFFELSESIVKVILPVVLTEPMVLARFERNSMIARE